jgi:hypothetical protein
MTKRKLPPIPAGFTIEEATVQFGRRTMRLEGKSLRNDDVVVRVTQAKWGKPVQIRAYVTSTLFTGPTSALFATSILNEPAATRVSLSQVFAQQSELDQVKALFKLELGPADTKAGFVPAILPESTVVSELPPYPTFD